MSFLTVLFQFLILGYLVTLGFGIVVAQRRGAEAVNRFWIRSGKSLLRGSLRLLGRLANWLASLIR